MATDTEGQPASTGGVDGPRDSIVLHDLLNLAARQHEIPWQPFHPGVEVHWIYSGEDNRPAAALIRFQPGGRVPLHEHRGYEHIFILSGSQTDETGRLCAGSLKIHPPGTRHSIFSEEGCLVLAVYERTARFLPAEPGAAG